MAGLKLLLYLCPSVGGLTEIEYPGFFDIVESQLDARMANFVTTFGGMFEGVR